MQLHITKQYYKVKFHRNSRKIRRVPPNTGFIAMQDKRHFMAISMHGYFLAFLESFGSFEFPHIKSEFGI